MSTQNDGENPQVPCKEGSQPWTILLPPGDRRKCLQTLLLSQLGGWVLQASYWGDATTHMTTHGTVLSTKNYQADVERPATEGQGREDRGMQCKETEECHEQ